MSKAFEVALNPMTALGYVGKDLPDHFSRGPRDPLDYAVDIINPAQYANDANNVVQGIEKLDGARFLEGAVGLAPLPLLKDAAVMPIRRGVQGAKKLLKKSKKSDAARIVEPTTETPHVVGRINLDSPNQGSDLDIDNFYRQRDDLELVQDPNALGALDEVNDALNNFNPIDNEIPQSLYDRINLRREIRDGEALREEIFPGSTIDNLVNTNSRPPTGFDLTRPAGRATRKVKRNLPSLDEVELDNGLVLVNNPSRVTDQAALLGNYRALKEVYDKKGGGKISLHSWRDTDGELYYYLSSNMPNSTIKAGRAYKTLEGFVPKGGKVLEKLSLSYDSFKNVLARGKSPNYKLFAKGKTQLNNMAVNNQFKVPPNGLYGMSFNNKGDADLAVDELNFLLGKYNLPKANSVENIITLNDRPDTKAYSIEIPNIGLEKLYAILGITTAGAATSSKGNEFKQGGKLKKSFKKENSAFLDSIFKL
jgi:hypothetical protein